MSPNMRGLLCEGVMIWVPSDLSDGELSNEYQYEGSIVWGGDATGTIGFDSLRAYKWVPIWGVYCVWGWWYGYHRICLTESFQISTNMRGLLCEGVMIWVPLGLSCWELSNESQYEGSIVWGGDDMGSIGFVSLRAFKWVPIWEFYCVRWVPLDLFDWELSNEYQYEGSIVWGGDDMDTIGFVWRRAFKWVPTWGVYCLWGWWYGYASDLSDGELSNKSQYEGAIVWRGDVMGTTGFVSRRCFKWVPIWGVYCVRGWCYGYHWICLIESFQMSPNMRGWCYGYHWICLIESFQMSPNTRGLLCEGVMIWVPSDLSDGELSNESQYEGASVWGGDVMGTTGFVSRRAFKWVRI